MNNDTRNPFTVYGSELLGGLLAAIIALPIALAFGVASGMGATAGLYGAIACGILAAAFGGTPAMVSGPTGPVTVGIAALTLEHPGEPHLVLSAAVVAGIFQIVLGRLKVGQLVHYIPHPVVSGFMTGIGVIIICVQLLPLCGFKTEGDVFTALQTFVSSIAQANLSALGLGLATIALVYLVPAIRLRVPPLLVALVAMTALSVYLKLDVPRIGAMPEGLPNIVFPTFQLHNLHIILLAGATLAILGTIDSLLTSVLLDKLTHSRHNSDRELFGQGIGNIVAGLIGGIPGSGTTMPSVVNVNAGGRRKLSAVFAGALLLCVLLGLGKIAAFIPLSVLAGLLITVGISIMDRKTLLAITKAPKADVAVMLTVLTLTVFVDLVIAVAVGVALASTLFAKKLADSHLSEVGKLATLEHWHHLSNQLPASISKHLYIYDFTGPLFFGEVKNFIDAHPLLEEARCIILRFNDVPFIDQTGAYALEDAVRNWQKSSTNLIFVGLNSNVRWTLENFGFVFTEANSFATTREAVALYHFDCG